MAVQIGPKIGIEGEKEYRAQISQIIQQTKNLDAAMKKTTAVFDSNTSALTKNRAQAQNLVQSIALAKDKLVAQNAVLEQAKAKYGENARQTLSWQQAVDTTTASIRRMETELKNLGNAANFSDLDTKIADLGTKMENMGKKLMGIGAKMSMAITVPLVAAGKAAVGLASNMEEASSKVDVVFGSMSESVKQFTETSLDMYGVSNVKAMEMIGTFGSMATSMGISQNEAAKMATTLTGLAGDMASFHNSEVEVTQTALAGVFTGETEALKKFGIAMTQANLEEFAERQGKVYNSMSEGEKVMTRYEFILDKQKDAMGDYQRTQDGTANSINTFKGAIQELGVAFGEAILPVITPVIQMMTSFIKILTALPEPVKKIVVVFGMLLAAVGPVILVVGAFMSSIGSIMTNGPQVVAEFGKIGAACKALAADFLALDSAAAPWIALALVISIAGIAIAENWDTVGPALADAADSIKSAFEKMAEGNKILMKAYQGIAEKMVDEFKQLPAKVAQAISEAIEAVKEVFRQMVRDAKQSGRDFVMGFVDGIESAVNKVIKVVKDIANTIKDFLGFSCPDKGPLHEYETWMPDFMQGLAKGIRGNMGLVRGAMNDVAKTMAIPLDANASMNMALAGAGNGSTAAMIGGTSMNVYVDHISEINDLIRIQNQAQQRYRMGAR